VDNGNCRCRPKMSHSLSSDFLHYVRNVDRTIPRQRNRTQRHPHSTSDFSFRNKSLPINIKNNMTAHHRLQPKDKFESLHRSCIRHVLLRRQNTQPQGLLPRRRPLRGGHRVPRPSGDPAIPPKMVDLLDQALAICADECVSAACAAEVQHGIR
jgi:hypothetical protein